MYPEHNQLDPDNPDCREESAYPANPDSDMDGRNSLVNVSTLPTIATMASLLGIARYHNIFGPEGHLGRWREKAPAAICRKVAKLPESGGLSRCGEMGYKLVPSCSLMNASKQLED